MSDKFFLRCSSQQCAAEFRARDIGAGGFCARRVIVESVPSDVQSVVLQRLDHPLPVGIYEVTLTHRYYGTLPVTAAELANALSADAFRAPYLAVKALDGGTNLTQLRQEWIAQERWGLARMIGYWTIDLLALITGLVASYLSTRAYRRRLFGLQPGRLPAPIAVQVVVFAVSLASLVFFWLPALVGIVAPILLVVWLYEAAIFMWSCFSRTRAQ